MLSVIVVLLVVSRKRRSDLTGAKSKKNAPRFMIIEKKGKVLFIYKNRSNARAYYIRQCSRVKSKARIAYKISKKYKIASAKAYSKQFHALKPSYILQKCKNWYNKNKDCKILKSTCYSKENYGINPDPKKEVSRKYYQNNPQPKKEAALSK